MQHAALRKVSVWPKAQAKHYNVGGYNVGGLRSILSIGSLQKFCPAPQHQFKRIVDDNDSTSSKDTHAMQRCGGARSKVGPKFGSHQIPMFSLLGNGWTSLWRCNH